MLFRSPDAPQRVSEVLGSDYIGQGSVVEEFEAKLESVGLVNPITVNSGTAALTLAMKLVGLGTSDEVISTPMTCLATNAPLAHCGSKIVWADVHPITGLIDPKDVQKKITPKTKAIVAVDYGGRPCDYDALRQLGLPIIEDAAHAVMTTYKGKHIAESGGDYVCFSFQAIKHLTTGDGGCLVCRSSVERTRAKLLRWYGFDRDQKESFRCGQDVVEVGQKWHMNDINAAIGLGNLKHLREIVACHKSNAEFFCDNIYNSNVVVPLYSKDSSYWIFIVLSDDIQSLSRHLSDNGIMSSPVHQRNDVYTAFRAFRSHLKNMDVFFSRQLAVPVGWWVGEQERERIVDAINSWRM